MFAREKSCTAESPPLICAHQSSALIPMKRIKSRHPFDLRKLRKDLCNQGKGARKIGVITIQPAENLSSCTSKTAGNGDVLSPVCPSLPMGEPGFITADDLNAIVRASIIDH